MSRERVSPPASVTETVRSAQTFTPAQPVAPAPAPAQYVPHATLQQQKDCDKLARKAADKWIADNSVTDNVVYGQEIQSHMNARLGECLVMISGKFHYDVFKYPNAPYRINPIFDVLFDAIGGHQFGYYYWDNPREVTAPPAEYCWVEGSAYTVIKPCGDEHEWYEVARKYMSD
jgi:hypothetical protein